MENGMVFTNANREEEFLPIGTENFGNFRKGVLYKFVFVGRIKVVENYNYTL